MYLCVRGIDFASFYDFNYYYFMGLFELVAGNEYVGDITIPTQVIEYNQNFSQTD